jgi:hypothetical protein
MNFTYFGGSYGRGCGYNGGGYYRHGYGGRRW